MRSSTKIILRMSQACLKGGQSHINVSQLNLWQEPDWADGNASFLESKCPKPLRSVLKDSDYIDHPQDLWKRWRTSEPTGKMSYKTCFLGGKTISVLVPEIYTLRVDLQSSRVLCSSLPGRGSSLSRRARHKLHVQQPQPAARARGCHAICQTQDACLFRWWIVSVSPFFLR